MQTVTLQDIRAAEEKLKGIAYRTDLLPSTMLSDETREVYLKTESLQQTGSFKVRGAYIKIDSLNAEERARGVIASSAGNHAQGVALAAKAFGIPATIVMPEGASLAKLSATRALGATVVQHGPNFDAAFEYAQKLQQETNAVFVHAFNDPKIVAGQGTVGLEILEDLPDVDTIVVPVGGGGLIAGIAVAVKAIRPEVRIVGVEAAGAASMLESIRAGHVTSLSRTSTFADGIAVGRPGDLTFAICRDFVDEIVTVDEDEIAQTILYLLERCKMITEGAGAVSVAAIMGHKFHCYGKVAAVLSGGNIDVTMLSKIIDKGLIKAGRRLKFCTIIEDKPGQLGRLLSVIAENKANVISVRHERADLEIGLGYTMVEIDLETQDLDHVHRLTQAITTHDFAITSQQ